MYPLILIVNANTTLFILKNMYFLDKFIEKHSKNDQPSSNEYFPYPEFYSKFHFLRKGTFKNTGSLHLCKWKKDESATPCYAAKSPRWLLGSSQETQEALTGQIRNI